MNESFMMCFINNHLRNFFTVEMDSPDRPTIDAKSTNFLRGETILLNCTVNYKPNSAISLEWSIPRGNFNGVCTLYVFVS